MSASAWTAWPSWWKVLRTLRARSTGTTSLPASPLPFDLWIGTGSVTRGSSCARSWKWQRAPWPSPRSCIGGSCLWQMSSESPHRSANTQPGRSAPSAGGNPAIVSSRSWSLRAPPRGMQRSNPTVYGWRGLSNTSCTLPCSTRRPAYSTPMRSHIFPITARLWLMNSRLVWNSARSALTRSRTSPSTVASRPVVGSSRISSVGSLASAIAITTRWFIPPDSWCG